MEPHGKNPRQLVVAVIPSRYDSVRLPGKLLLPLGGKPLLLQTVERAGQATLVDRVIVATDDERIASVVERAGTEVRMTSRDHVSGSDRIAEAAAGLPDGALIVNLQGDEPSISPNTIDRAIEALMADSTAKVSTTCERIEYPADVLNPNVVKVVIDPDRNALYFSRSPIPFPRDASMGRELIDVLRGEPGLLNIFRKHTGLYVFRKEFLIEFSKLPQSPLEKIERLEQLRILEAGGKIKVVEADGNSIGVDTLEDYERVKLLFESVSNEATV